MYFPQSQLQALTNRLRIARGREYWLSGAAYNPVLDVHILRDLHPDDEETIREWVKNNWDKLDRDTRGLKHNVGERVHWVKYAPPKEPSLLSKLRKRLWIK